MSDLSRVPGPASPFKGSSAKLLTVVLIGILVAILKPWGGSSPEPVIGASAPPVSPQASGAVTATASPGVRDVFDFGVFEGFEPKPAWEIWPAGREFSLGFAMKVTADGEDGPTASPGPTPAAPSSAGPGSAPTASGVPAAQRTATPAPTGLVEPPRWSHTITISPASTLTVVAINMPLDYRIPGVHLWRTDPAGGRQEVPVVRVPSPWPDHFLVIGVDDGAGDALRAWPPGQYELVLQIQPGDHVRTIAIDVEARPDAAPTPAPSEEPAPSAPAAS